MLVLIGWWVDLLLFCRRLRQEIIEENVNVSALAQLDISMIWPRVVLYSGEEASIYLATGVSKRRRHYEFGHFNDSFAVYRRIMG